MSGGSSVSCFAFLCFDLLWWTWSICSCLHVCIVPGLPWCLGSFVPQPSLHHTISQPLFISQCEHDKCLTKFFFINNPKLFGWGQGLFTQSDQVGLCSSQPHVWPILHGQRWPGTRCSCGNGIPACYSVHDLPAMQRNFFLLCRLVQTHSFSGVQKGDPSTVKTADRKTNPLSTVVVMYAVIIPGIKFKSKQKCRHPKIWKQDVQTCSPALFGLESFWEFTWWSFFTLTCLAMLCRSPRSLQLMCLLDWSGSRCLFLMYWKMRSLCRAFPPHLVIIW